MRAQHLGMICQAVVNFYFLNLAFGTVPLLFDQWLLYAAMASGAVVQ